MNKGFLSRMWRRLAGDPKEFSMENRAFNAISIITTVLLLIILPFNYFIGLYKIVLLIGIILVAQVFFYYLSRVRKKFHAGIPLYATVAYAIIIINFFLNSGSYGPTLMLFILVYILLTALTPKKQLWLWIVIHICSMLALLWIEYARPATVPDTYLNRSGRYIDMASSYVIIILSVHMLMVYIRKNYDDEKKQAEKKCSGGRTTESRAGKAE